MASNTFSEPVHIILVQDDTYLVDTRKAILEREGYSVDVVHTVREARARCAELHCDLMIIDSNPNREAALALCEEMKQQDPSTNVAVMTGYNVGIDSNCPDDVIPQEEGPAGFVAKVKRLLRAQK